MADRRLYQHASTLAVNTDVFLLLDGVFDTVAQAFKPRGPGS